MPRNWYITSWTKPNGHLASKFLSSGATILQTHFRAHLTRNPRRPRMHGQAWNPVGPRPGNSPLNSLRPSLGCLPRHRRQVKSHANGKLHGLLQSARKDPEVQLRTTGLCHWRTVSLTYVTCKVCYGPCWDRTPGRLLQSPTPKPLLGNKGTWTTQSLTLDWFVTKCVEHILFSLIQGYLDGQGIITQVNNGFRGGHSYEVQLFVTCNTGLSAVGSMWFSSTNRIYWKKQHHGGQRRRLETNRLDILLNRIRFYVPIQLWMCMLMFMHVFIIA